MILIKNGYIMTMEGIDYPEGSILIDNGKIVRVGNDIEPCDNCRTIDAKGLLVTPGLVDGHCHIGMIEQGIGAEGDDVNELSDPITPQLRGIDGINPRCSAFHDAIMGGVTTAVTGPGSGNVIGGQFVAIKTYGNIVDDMIIKEPVAMKVAFGENPKVCYGSQKKAPYTRMANVALIRETLIKATEYYQEIKAAQEKGTAKPRFDIKLDAMVPVIKKEIPLKAHAHRIDDMFTALRVAKEFNIDITLDHCTEAHLDADRLAKENCGFLVGPSFGSKSKYELKEKTFNTPRVMHEAGIEFGIITDSPVVPSGYLALCAGLAVKAGLPQEVAWRAITINPARISGISDKVGSLKAGKDADIVLFQGNPLLDLGYKTVMTIVNGNIAYADDTSNERINY